MQRRVMFRGVGAERRRQRGIRIAVRCREFCQPTVGISEVRHAQCFREAVTRDSVRQDLEGVGQRRHGKPRAIGVRALGNGVDQFFGD